MELFGDEIERITRVDPLTGELLGEVDDVVVFPATHYVAGTRTNAHGHRRESKPSCRSGSTTSRKTASCSRPSACVCAPVTTWKCWPKWVVARGSKTTAATSTGASPGQAPHTLLDFFPKDYLLVIDESHVAVPQLHGQYHGDRSRKETLIEHGFRLPSAADNRPLRYEELLQRVNQCIFMSATPSAYEISVSNQIVEQIVRPTGLIDPEVVVRPTKGQIDDLMTEMAKRTAAGDRVLVTTLTKKMAEDLTDYLLEQGLKVRYLHSNVETLERIEILRDLRLGEFDVLVGINLLREGLDLPEVSLVAILDADKEGFLRSETSLIQTIGRAARNVDGSVIMYADEMTDSMRRAISETHRRRQLQQEYNAEHGINPQTVRRAVSDILVMLGRGERLGRRRRHGPGAGRRPSQPAPRPGPLGPGQHAQGRPLAGSSPPWRRRCATPPADLRFEYAARLRDEVADLKKELKALAEMGVPVS